MTTYSAQMRHSKETLRRFTRVQYDTFESAQKLILCVLSVLMILFGVTQLFGSSSLLGIICLLAGCLILTNRNAKADGVAEQVAEQLHGQYPVISYTFSGESFSDGPGRPDVPYSGLYRLLCDEEYLYLFTSKASGYMIPCASVEKDGQTGSAEELKEAIAAASGLSWSRPVNWLSLNLKDILGLLKKKK